MTTESTLGAERLTGYTRPRLEGGEAVRETHEPSRETAHESSMSARAAVHAPTPRAHPDALERAAFLAGRRSAPVGEASVLVLGCGEGQDLLPIALGCPTATVVGLEPDPAALDVALRGTVRLGLDDVTLVDAFEALGDRRFDYVLVPDLALRPGARLAPILETIRVLLAPDGVAFLAHACPPGRALAAELAACVRAAARDATTGAEAVALAREALGALAAHLPDDHPFAGGLAPLLAQAVRLDDAALAAAYLAPPPEAVRRDELDVLLAAVGLAELAELGPPPADPRVGRDLRLSLARHGEPSALGTWTDLLSLRDRRWIALGAADVEAEPPHFLEQLAFGRFASPLRLAEPDPWLGPRAPMELLSPDGLSLRLEHPIEKAALALLAHVWPVALSFDELSARLAPVLESVPGAPPLDEAGRGHLGRFLLEQAQLGWLRCTRRAPAPGSVPREHPDVGPLTRYEAERGGPLTTPYHDAVPLDPIDARLVSWLDGRPLAALDAELAAAARAGVLTVGPPGAAWGPEQTLDLVRHRLGALLARLAAHGLLF